MSYNYDISRNSPNCTPESQSRAVFGQPRVIKGITIHWWGNPATNPSFAGVRDYLCRVNGNTSAHLVVSGTNRQVACIVNYSDVAWHSGNAVGNATTIGIECDPRCRDEDYDVVAEVVADIRSAFGDVPIYSHNMWTSTACPGNYDIERIDKLSYTKYSAAEWGKGGDKTPQQIPTPLPPAPAPKPPTPSQEPSPTTQDSNGKLLPDTGVSVANKHDYSEENNTLLKQILTIVKAILDKLTGVFK